ncbi:fibronectin type III domain-containing protein [Paenibacillus sp. UNC451MF]|uniref:fibronectin type III domain-containing protein n=1 Tax=Paenibacillus sp. UNC451MF TaxID=1449063 RepID=UPI00048BDA6C|nr:fibronectin type III domain-containing protein [Paenibacillus sp. UNC451MF]
MADQNSIVYYEDWSDLEPVNVINTVPPDNVTNLTASKVQGNLVTLSWTASSSNDVTGYGIYNGTVYVGSTASTTYDVTGLNPETTYTFAVKTINKDGLTSNGASISVTTPILTYALSMNGTTDYVQTPSLSFDTVIMDILVDPKSMVYNSYLDATRGIPQSAFGRNSSGYDYLQSAWKSVSINGVDKTAGANISAIVPTQQRITVTVVLKSPGKSILVLFANQLGSIPMKGILYSVKIMSGGVVTALYDFTKPFTGTAVPDSSGNNQTAKLQGGTWING